MSSGIEQGHIASATSGFEIELILIVPEYAWASDQSPILGQLRFSDSDITRIRGAMGASPEILSGSVSDLARSASSAKLKISFPFLFSILGKRVGLAEL